MAQQRGTLQKSEQSPQQEAPGRKKVKEQIDPKGIGRDTLIISDYKIISYDRDTTYFDTDLTIQKDYKHNYLRRDNFELLRFNNMGQTYNNLAYSYDKLYLYPQIGMRSKHFAYMATEDISYYDVATPTTDLFYRNGFEQGQVLDAFITLNTSRRFNASIAYKGLRSLGKYQHILASNTNFRLTTSYRTKDNRYRLRGHWTSQNLNNQENGGLTPQSVENFENGITEFRDRARLEVYFEDAENELVGKRYYFDHDFRIFKEKDSIVTPNLRIGHVFNYETKKYYYQQDSPNMDYFGEAYTTDDIFDEVALQALYNELNLSFTTKTFGELKFRVSNYDYNYFFKSIVFQDDGVIPNKLSGNEFAFGGLWQLSLAGMRLSVDLMSRITGDQGGSYIDVKADYTLTDDMELRGSFFSSAISPNFNAQLYQSSYKAYNWYNPDFDKEKKQHLEFHFTSKKWGAIGAEYTVLNDHIYFASILEEDDGPIVNSAPYQATNTINYLKLKLQTEIRWKKFALDNTFMYQNTTQSANIFNVPDFTTRNTLYYSTHLFKKAVFLQTGLVFNYFTEYYMNAYDPLIGEFFIQEQQKIGGFPRFDYFVNVKVRRTRVFLKAEHFNSDMTGYNFFSAPNYPYRDFIVRFGIVWNFFN